jgi:hypothetical protein
MAGPFTEKIDFESCVHYDGLRREECCYCAWLRRGESDGIQTWVSDLLEMGWYMDRTWERVQDMVGSKGVNQGIRVVQYRNRPSFDRTVGIVRADSDEHEMSQVKVQFRSTRDADSSRS